MACRKNLAGRRPVVVGGVAREQASYEGAWILGLEEIVLTGIMLPKAVQSERGVAAVVARTGS
jgi:hypothetical protein